MAVYSEYMENPHGCVYRGTPLWALTGKQGVTHSLGSRS